MSKLEIDRFRGLRAGKTTAMLRYAIEMADSGNRVAVVSQNKSDMADWVEKVMGHNCFPEGLYVIGIHDERPRNVQKRLISK